MELEERSRFPWALLAGAAVVLLLVASATWLLRRSPERLGAEQHLPLGPAEKVYAAQVHFSGLQMSRAANFLNQEVTFLSGEISNDGSRTLRDIEVTVEYRDSLDQVILREAMRPFGAHPLPLAAGQRRDFQLAFEHIPVEWNHQYPSIRVTGLLLE